jgi:hypothetical protein
MVMDLHLPLQIVAYQHYPYELHSYSWNGVLNTTLFDYYQDKTDRHDILLNFEPSASKDHPPYLINKKKNEK